MRADLGQPGVPAQTPSERTPGLCRTPPFVYKRSDWVIPRLLAAFLQAGDGAVQMSQGCTEDEISSYMCNTKKSLAYSQHSASVWNHCYYSLTKCPSGGGPARGPGALPKAAWPPAVDSPLLPSGSYEILLWKSPPQLWGGCRPLGPQTMKTMPGGASTSHRPGPSLEISGRWRAEN